MQGTVELPRWRTRTDLAGHVKLLEDYARDGAPGHVVEGWVDGPTQPGVFSADDTYARRREYTWHPALAHPLTVAQASTITGAMEHVTTFDFDADGDTEPNESPTSRVSRRIETGKTLDASGQAIGFTHEVRYTYDAQGRLLSVNGPRRAPDPVENHTAFEYYPDDDPVAIQRGRLHFVRRYPAWPSTANPLVTEYQDLDAQGNPGTVVDPNGRETTFTYDLQGRVTSVTPPWTGGGSAAIAFGRDLDGNLTQVTFPPDTEGNPYVLTLGYDAKSRLLFVKDTQGNAIVYDYTDTEGGPQTPRIQRESRYAGFTALTPESSRGTLRMRTERDYNPQGRLSHAYNPLFTDQSVFTEYAYDGRGDATDVTDENGKDDDLLYDALRRLDRIDQLRAATYTTDFAYDSLSNVSRVTDPAPKSTDYVTDDAGRLVKVVSPDTGPPSTCATRPATSSARSRRPGRRAPAPRPTRMMASIASPRSTSRTTPTGPSATTPTHRGTRRAGSRR
jgi:YD repeat-containing protein